MSETEDCKKCGGEITSDRFKDAVCKDGKYYTVHLRSCVECGDIDDDGTWAE